MFFELLNVWDLNLKGMLPLVKLKSPMLSKTLTMFLLPVNELRKWAKRPTFLFGWLTLSDSVLTDYDEFTKNSDVSLMHLHLVNDDTLSQVLVPTSEMAALQKAGLLFHPITSSQAAHLASEVLKIDITFV